MSDDDAMWAPPNAQRSITVGDMFSIAKKLRLQVYYDTGDPEGDDDRTSAVREGRCSALTVYVEAIDETFKFDSELTQDDLERWRK